MKMKKLPDYFGCNLFGEKEMKKSLSPEIYVSLMKTIENGEKLDIDVANAVAFAMKNWAIEKGATHFTHWFQPMTGLTAEKHDSFIELSSEGEAIMDFSGSKLIQGEPDASSFPSGGLRATFEARGYTAWDPTSYAFIRGKTLFIPTAFCAYTGEALDKKTPLLRSMSAVSKQAVRILKLMGNRGVMNVRPMAGAEQEYFLVPLEAYKKRPDLRYTGRTLFGAPAPKGQEMDDHYFGAIKSRVASFMEEINVELWKLGIAAKTEHNEVAPSQHELACIYSTANLASDQNQLVMEVMKKTAEKHGLVCLLHEKPFNGVNGSGKHNNWSLATDTGMNLLSPGDTPKENLQFLLFLTAVIKAVDDYQDLLRISVASAENDHRLGANEAPPAVVSVFLGEDLTALLDSLADAAPDAKSLKRTMSLGTDVLPSIRRDTTDRNRTSPFAFTGNKFEFRMPGSSQSIAAANTMLNSAVAATLKEFADRIEASADRTAEIHNVIVETVKAHKRIIFNGNGYDASWPEQAVKRGLSNYRTTPDALPHLLDEKNIRMLTSMKVYTETELKSRYEILLENYCKTVLIEARTMEDMAMKLIIPAVEGYAADLAQGAAAKKDVLEGLGCRFEKAMVKELSEAADSIYAASRALGEAVKLVAQKDVLSEAAAVRDEVIPLMEELRRQCDSAEVSTASSFWPLPSYGELMFWTT